MSTRDIASDLNVVVAHSAVIDTDTDTFSNDVNIADYDDGFMFFMAIPAWTDGTYVLTLQDSPDNSVWTDVPAEKLIDPAGNGSITLSAATSADDVLERIGAFSVNKHMRAKIVSTVTTDGATVTVYAVRKAELRPAS